MNSEDTTEDEHRSRAQGDTLTYASWAEALREGVLLGQRCNACDHVTGTPKSVCPECKSRDLSSVELPTSGTVFSETMIEVTPVDHVDDKYRVGIIDLGPTRVLARIEDAADIGDNVEFVGTVEHDEMPGPVFG